ncbi:MAG: hypothetical protein MHM6MM_006799 [Cercozoa sp. M6MM]
MQRLVNFAHWAHVDENLQRPEVKNAYRETILALHAILSDWADAVQAAERDQSDIRARERQQGTCFSQASTELKVAVLNAVTYANASNKLGTKIPFAAALAWTRIETPEVAIQGLVDFIIAYKQEPAYNDECGSIVIVTLRTLQLTRDQRNQLESARVREF